MNVPANIVGKSSLAMEIRKENIVVMSVMSMTDLVK